MDEQTAIQALDRKDPILHFSPGRADRRGFEYIRHGTPSLYAALDTTSGMVVGQTTEYHTSQTFIAFLAQLLTTVPPRHEGRTVCDNLSAYKGKQIARFAAELSRLQSHFAPTNSSWLHQVALR